MLVLAGPARLPAAVRAHNLGHYFAIVKLTASLAECQLSRPVKFRQEETSE